MTGVLAHTLVWTGVLIAAVLLLRRPVARWFGPQVAYALWALPLLRLILPPVTLPAWMAPQAPVSAPVALPPADDAAIWQPIAAELPPAADPAPPAAGFDLFAALAELPLIEAGLAVWLGGAGVFMWRRFAAYFVLRDALLAQGREVGCIRGPIAPIRLVETPATAAPLAMGVIDPVIALPPGFMALHDRQARDLALAHELAHHRGADLLVNFLAQPLFALHWFNPLARYGWLAMRRDQEAACDARVMARRDAAERAAYAALIARYAAAPLAAGNAALAAPMACPVLGEKSIIHRLRSLSMSNLSPRRRLAGLALLGSGLLILPLTASISYAAAEQAGEVPQPTQPPEPPAPPAPPAGPDVPVPPAPPAPPPPPAPPAPPETPLAFLFLGSDETGDGERKVIVSERTERNDDGEERRVKIVRRLGPDAEGLKALTVNARAVNSMTKQEHEEMLAALREGLAEADRELADLPRTIALAMAEADKARAAMPRMIVRQECAPGSDAPTSATTDKDGRQVITICKSRIQASALTGARTGLEQARDQIARDTDIPEDTRKQMLDHLDRQIARWAEKEG